MGGGDQVEHLMDHHVLEQVLRLLYKLCVQADRPRSVVAAAPLGLHALEEVVGNLDTQLRLPLAD